MENLITLINRWIHGVEPSPEIRVAGWPEIERRLKERATTEQIQDRAIVALDLQVEIAAEEIRAGRTTAALVAVKIFDGMSPEVKKLTGVTLSQILDAIDAEMQVPKDARRQ